MVLGDSLAPTRWQHRHSKRPITGFRQVARSRLVLSTSTVCPFPRGSIRYLKSLFRVQCSVYLLPIGTLRSTTLVTAVHLRSLWWLPSLRANQPVVLGTRSHDHLPWRSDHQRHPATTNFLIIYPGLAASRRCPGSQLAVTIRPERFRAARSVLCKRRHAVTFPGLERAMAGITTSPDVSWFSMRFLLAARYSGSMS